MTRVIQHPLRLAFVCAGVIVAVGGFAIAGSEFADTELSGWIEALSTLVALLAATTAAAYAAGAFRLEIDRDEERRSEKRAAQAGLVSVWGSATYQDVQQDGRMLAHLGKVLIDIRNASQLPVTQMVVTMHAAAAQGDPYDLRMGPERAFLGEHRFHNVPPTDHAIPIQLSRPGVADFVNELRRTDPGATAVLLISMRFRDAAGIVWHRSEIGELTQVKPA